ncbi:MAG TPA: hypothetical protein VLY22_01375 [Candidatus Nitrosotalea sp.]|nr:hypothetical protein [Candidatus Nitrosotalea sp.]
MHHGTASTFIDEIEEHSGSGTSVEPDSSSPPMLMTMRSGWMLMLHGVAFVVEQQQTGPRGADKFFSSNWAMGMAQRKAGPGTLTLRSMLSLEPATITGRLYPELFQVGETAFGRPIVDGQHPHNFFMELAGIFDVRAGDHTLISLYAAPVGDPALGPPAFPHRASADEDPLAVLGHHSQDSTHISGSVFTVGAAYRIVRIEASAYHGREPGENRWTLPVGNPDSWAARLTLNPFRNWSAQYSIGRLHSPEAISPQEDVLRMTASLDYHRAFARDDWASIVVWGRNKNLPDGEVFSSYLLESRLRFASRNAVWTRLENVDRSNELLLGGNPAPPGFEDHFLARIQAYSFGYDRDILVTPRTRTALGAQFTAYGVPGSLQLLYGDVPVGVALFLRFRPGRTPH